MTKRLLSLEPVTPSGACMTTTYNSPQGTQRVTLMGNEMQREGHIDKRCDQSLDPMSDTVNGS